MNGIDYSRKLDLERQNYRQKADETRRAAESYTKDVKENYENKVEDIRENSLKHKANLEEKFKDSYDNMDRSTRDALLDKQLTFNKKLDTERKEFTGIRKENLEDFNRRFKVLNDSYQSSIDELKETSKERGDYQSENYEAKVSKLQAEKDQALKEFQYRSSVSNDEVASDYRKEKSEIIDAKDKEMRELVKQEQDKRNFLKNTAVKSVEDLKNDQEASLKRLSDVTDARIRDVQNNSSAKINELNDKSTQKLSDLNNKAQSESLAQNKEFNEAFEKQSFENRQAIRDLNSHQRARGLGKDSPANVSINEKKLELERLSNESRIDTLKDQKENVEKIYAEREERAIDRFQDGYREMRIDLSDKLQEQEREMSEVNRVERYKDLKLMSEKDDSHYKVLNEERENSSREINKVKREARENFQRVTKTYSGDLRNVQTIADAQVDEMKKNTTEEKKSLQNSLQANTQESLANERKIQNEKYSKMEQSFQKKFLNLQNKNTETKTAYENKMRNLITATNDKIRQTKEDLQESANNQLKMERENNESKLKQLRDSMALLRATSDKKLTEQRLENTQKISELTYGYENKLKNQEEKFKDIIDQNQRKAEIDNDRLRLATAQEKETLMEQYEQKLERMEAMNNQKLTNMEKYAGLQISQKRGSIQA